MNNKIHIDIKDGALDPVPAFSFVQGASQGAISSFIGVVRNEHENKVVSGMSYDVHEELAQKTLSVICDEVCHSWKDVHIYVQHASGDLNVGDASVVIAISAPHREESFLACRYIIEEIKKRLPVWKKEHYLDKESCWLPGYTLTETEGA